MKPGKLDPAYLRALMEGTQKLHKIGDRTFSHIDEIVIHGDELELRWEGRPVITFDLAEILSMSRCLPVSIELDVKVE